MAWDRAKYNRTADNLERAMELIRAARLEVREPNRPQFDVLEKQIDAAHQSVRNALAELYRQYPAGQ
jgi:hypothetical protein